MSLKVKLISVVSVFILVLSMLLVGVLAATGSFTINLKGNVQFNIDDSTLYIKDIRLSDGQTEGETIDNFLPGFVWESFELDFGTVSSDSGTISIEIDVINTTATTYNASSQSSLSNATLSVSGTIAGDSVPLDQVATYDGISGTIYISVQDISSASINLDNITIDISELQGFNVTINNTSGSSWYVYKDGIDGSATEVADDESLTFIFFGTDLLISNLSSGFDSYEQSNYIDVSTEFVSGGVSAPEFYEFDVNDITVYRTETGQGGVFQLFEDCIIEITHHGGGVVIV